MNPLAVRRSRAYLRDCLTYLGLVGSTVPLGVLAQRRGWGRRRAFVLVVSAVPPVLATVLAARSESGPGRATRGKRSEGLAVLAADGSAPSLARTLLRNTIKIAIPWQLGHTVAIGAALGGFEDRDRLTLAATAITYPLLGVMLALLLQGEGRTLHDRLAGTLVVQAAGSSPRRG